jgi:hypothetical protein
MNQMVEYCQLALIPEEPKKFVAPQIGDIMLAAAKAGLPEIEALKFFLFYESKGWYVGKTKMKNWLCALAGWTIRWREGNRSTNNNGAMTVIKGKEMERVIEQRKSIRATYGDHQTWTKQDVEKYNSLGARLKQLRAELGVVA